MNRSLSWWLAVSISTTLMIGCSKSKAPAPPNAEGQPLAKSPPESVTLALRWTAGQRFVHRIEQSYHAEIQTPASPTPMRQDVSQTNEFALSILEYSPANGARAQIELQSVRTEMNLGSITLRYDSEDPGLSQSSSMAPVIAQALHFPVGVQILPDNRISNLSGLEPLFGRSHANAPPQASQMIRSLFSQENLEAMISPGVLPNSPVRIGDRWTGNTPIDLGPLGAMTAVSDYRFEKWEDLQGRSCALISFTGTITNQSSQAASPARPALTLDSGKQSGRFWFAPDPGHVVASESERELSVRMGVPPPPGAQGAAASGATVRYSMRQTVKNRLIEITDLNP